ncbi:helix-turn-helix domain-containing protein [Romboutsia ilealis]|uniref:Helix-turn-helix domain-containing protein n=1 Tax=Romboutsia faecis TaxID=2764597 RepID=A0ABR7JTD8_9FIRM|nr:helix-turn-helix domain-containing protein [Romboutsia faecis]MBC5997896.1 helix-turn-helix domain-containing protein [Romboutsia faecis]MRN25591.1 helix-turn-helix domain-containing protein [Romboutsia ilealis]
MVSSNNINQNIDFIFDIIFDTLGLPLYFFDKFGTLKLSKSKYYNINNETFSILPKLFELNTYNPIPVIKSTIYMENFLSISILINNEFYGTLILGPCLYAPITEENIKSILSNNVSIYDKNTLLKYYSSLPIKTFSELVNISILTYYLIYNKKLNFESVLKENYYNDNIINIINKNIELSASLSRQNDEFHHSIVHEKTIMDCIRNGNKEKLLRIMSEPSEGNYGILAKNNPMRSLKNLLITSATLLTRAAIDGGMDTEIAYTLSDSYIQLIEEFNTVNDLNNLRITMSCDFADRVSNLKYINYPKTITHCISYIHKNIYNSISLESICNHLNFNSSYISRYFRKEVGVTISEFILKEKVEEAKRLLLSSDYSILEISVLLNFNDQSYFTKIFKRFTKTTPKKYRDTNKIK